MYRTKQSAGEILAFFVSIYPLLEDALQRAKERTRQTKRQIEPFQAAALYALARQYHLGTPGVRVLEIGTAYGYSAAILAEALPNAEIITLNPKGNEVEAARESFAPYYPNIEIKQMTSVQFLEEYTGTFDLIFVDGDHKHVRNDLPYWDKLNIGGLMLFHDYSPAGTRRECPPVYEAVNEFAQQTQHALDVLISDSDNIGMAGFYKRMAPLIFDDVEEIALQNAARFSTNDVHYLRTIYQMANAVPVSGSILEVGVTNGGSAAALSLTGRPIIGIDTFSGIPEPDENDSPRAHWKWRDAQTKGGWCVGDVDTLDRCFQSVVPNNPDDAVFTKADITLNPPEQPDGSLAVLHIDATLYRSTRAALGLYYPALAPGGLVIVNAYDYWGGVRKAVDLFIFGRNIQLHPFLKQHVYWYKS